MLLNLFSSSELILFAVFGIIVTLFLMVDLGLVNKNPKKISRKSTLNQSIFWVVISLLFGILIYLSGEGKEVTLEYYSAYFTEKALSMDNIFVILLILKYFKVEEEYYHRILYWGILGAVVFRAFFIFVGAYLIGEFHWILYIFGALVFGFKRQDQGLVFNPKPEIIISENDVLIILGDDDNLDRFRRNYL